MTLDKIYGCTLGEYLDYIDKTKESLVYELEKEIELLNKSRLYYADNKEQYTIDELVETLEISNLILKKQNHLKRVKAWQ